MTQLTRSDKVRYITFNDIKLENILIGVHLEEYNSSTERILTMTDAPSRILPYINTMVNSVTYEVNHQRIWI